MSEQQSAPFSKQFVSIQRWRMRRFFALQGALYGFGVAFLVGAALVAAWFLTFYPLAEWSLILQSFFIVLANALFFAVVMMLGMNFQVGSVVDRRWDSVEEKARKQTKVREIFSAAWNGLLVSLFAFAIVGGFGGLGALMHLDEALGYEGGTVGLVFGCLPFVAPICCGFIPRLIDRRLQRLESGYQLTANELYWEKLWATGREREIQLVEPPPPKPKKPRAFKPAMTLLSKRTRERLIWVGLGVIWSFFSVGFALAVYELVRYCLVPIFASAGIDLSFIPSTTDFFTLDQTVVFFISIVAAAIACGWLFMGQLLEAEAELDKVKAENRELIQQNRERE